MNINTLIALNLFVVLPILFLSIYLLIRVKRIEDKSIDVSSSDIIAFVEQMREMVIESERAAEILDSSIKEREAVLEDLSSIVQVRLNRFEKLAAEFPGLSDNITYINNSSKFNSENSNEDMLSIDGQNRPVYMDELRYQENLISKDYIEKIEAGEKRLKQRLDEQDALFLQFKQDAVQEKTILLEQFEKDRKDIEASFNNKLAQEKAIQEKLLEEIRKRDEALKTLIHSAGGQSKQAAGHTTEQNNPQIKPANAQNDESNIKRHDFPVQNGPIVATQPTIVAQPIVKSTEEVLRTRTEPILSKQIQDRIPAQQPVVIRSRTGVNAQTPAKEDILLHADIQAQVYKLLLNGMDEKQIAEKLKMPIKEVERHLSLKE